MPSPICRQQQLQSGFGVARTVGLFAHCPSSKAKGDVNGNQTGARKSAARHRRAGLGATRAAEASRGRLPFPRIFLSQSSSVPQDNFGTALPFPRIISRSALPFPRIFRAVHFRSPGEFSRRALPFPRIFRAAHFRSPVNSGAVLRLFYFRDPEISGARERGGEMFVKNKS